MATPATPKGTTHNVSTPKSPQLSPAQALPNESPEKAAGVHATRKATHSVSTPMKSAISPDQRGPGVGPHTALAPSVQKISPATGALAGGTAVSVIGYNMLGVTSATVGGAAVTGLTVLHDRKLTFNTPAGTAGAKDVVLTKADGPDTTVTGGFTYA